MVERLREIIGRYVPENTIQYCTSIWGKNPFSFKVTKERRSKVGDYRFNKGSGNHEITVNGSLNPYAFLITYLHEVAHLVHFKMHGNNRHPHGKVWKKIFQELMEPVLSDRVFPPEILHQLIKHMKNPKASSQSDPVLAKLLRQYDRNNNEAELHLEDLKEGEPFILDGCTYTKIKKRRTRSLCKENKTGKKYLISEMAQVKKIA
jgi:hypothetical protein